MKVIPSVWMVAELDEARALRRYLRTRQSRAGDFRRDSGSPNRYPSKSGTGVRPAFRRGAVSTPRPDSEVAGSALIGLCVEVAIDVLVIGIPLVGLVCLGFAIAGSST